MAGKTVNVTVFRFDPLADSEPRYQEYAVPCVDGMSAMNALDYIYENLDGTLAYYDHAGCEQGICARCTGKVNGKAGLFCQVPVEGDIRIEPVSAANVVKDLVVARKKKTGD